MHVQYKCCRHSIGESLCKSTFSILRSSTKSLVNQIFSCPHNKMSKTTAVYWNHWCYFFNLQPQISFEDFKVLFEQEREAAKHIDGRSRLGSLPAHFSTPIQTHHDTAFESIPSEIIVSPSDSISSEKRFTSRDFPDSPPVILRHKRLGRRSLPASYRREQKTPDFLSPIQPDKAPSGEMPGGGGVESYSYS